MLNIIFIMEPFLFYTRFNQTILLGKKARDLKELLDGIKTVPGSSIYHHTHRFLQQYQYLVPEPPNDFAYWVNNVLNEKLLGEKLFSINIIQFHWIEEIRKKFVEIIEQHLLKDARNVQCPEDEAFYFVSSKSFILKTPYVANNLNEFKDIVKKISADSLYFHIFEARLRLKKEDNDFSLWFRDAGYAQLANKMANLDPYAYTLESLRGKIISLME
ncbi:MAG: DUF5752 family protein [bacterium]